MFRPIQSTVDQYASAVPWYMYEMAAVILVELGGHFLDGAAEDRDPVGGAIHDVLPVVGDKIRSDSL